LSIFGHHTVWIPQASQTFATFTASANDRSDCGGIDIGDVKYRRQKTCLEDKVVQDGDHRSVGDPSTIKKGALQRRPSGTIKKAALTCIEDRLSYTSLSGLAETIVEWTTSPI
jgi:hypothetical protein